MALLEEVDIFADTGPPDEYLAHNPFGTIPCLMHGEFYLYETGAITRYIDETFPGVALQPSVSSRRARMNQIISLLDAYTYRPMVWDVYVQRIVVPSGGGQPDESLVAAALPNLEHVLQQLELLQDEYEFLTGDSVSLADLHAQCWHRTPGWNIGCSKCRQDQAHA
jgi:glutathione S-transferase